VDIPDLGSLILTHDPNGEIKGLKDWPVAERPPVGPPFFAFRIMVGIGLLMLALVATGNVLRWGGRVYGNRAFLSACEIAAPSGFIAVLAGWVTTEVGRQPWTVYGLLRTTDSVSPSLTGGNVLLSFIGYIAVYLLIFPAGLLIMARIVRGGPNSTVADSPVESGRPAGPVRMLPGSPLGERAPT
jgi:cytochrome d ubiquinol oxidase subunit I